MLPFDVEGFLRQALDEIWNRKQAGRLYDCAASNLVVHGPSGQELLGREEAIGDVLRWLAAFPDTQLTIEDLVWSGDDRRGFLVSLRQRFHGTHLGASIYGTSSTGRPVSRGMIAHYVIFEGLIRDVWQECDELELVRQLGLDLPAVLASLDTWRPLASAEPFGLGEVRRSLGQTPPAPLADAAAGACGGEDLVRRSLHDIWNRRLVGRIEEVYHPKLRWQLGDQPTTGRDDLTTHVLARLAAFPDLCMLVDQIICRGDDASGYATSIAWTLLGAHGGPGACDGPPTRRRVRLHGLTQQRIVAGRVIEEWTQCGELGLLRQLKKDSVCKPSIEAFAARATSPN